VINRGGRAVATEVIAATEEVIGVAAVTVATGDADATEPTEGQRPPWVRGAGALGFREPSARCRERAGRPFQFLR
jgi:hypothetical protein